MDQSVLSQQWLFSAHGLCFNTQISLVTIHSEAKTDTTNLPGHGQALVFREPDNNLQPDQLRPRFRPFYKHISKGM